MHITGESPMKIGVLDESRRARGVRGEKFVGPKEEELLVQESCLFSIETTRL